MTAAIKLNDAQIRKALESQNGPVWRDIQIRTNRVLNRAKVLCPVDGGRLRNSLTMEMRRESWGPTGRVGTNLEYALYVHEGTGLYGPRGRYIVPVRAKVLVWKTKRQVVGRTPSGRAKYAKRNVVFSKRSSGVRGRPFLKDALSAAT